MIITADVAGSGHFTVMVNGGTERALDLAETASALQRLSLRTGGWRGLGDDVGVNAPADVPPPAEAVFQVDRVRIQAN